jgi:hypothetical protein
MRAERERQVREAYALEDMPCMQVLTTAPAPLPTGARGGAAASAAHVAAAAAAQCDARSPPASIEQHGSDGQRRQLGRVSSAAQERGRAASPPRE